MSKYYGVAPGKDGVQTGPALQHFVTEPQAQRYCELLNSEYGSSDYIVVENYPNRLFPRGPKYGDDLPIEPRA